MNVSNRVLVVDDEECIRKMVELALGDEGYEVLSAPDGAAGLALLEQAEPDLILLDLKMPEMDGWQFARLYGQRPGPRAPLVVMTAAQNASRPPTVDGADGYLAKPFDVEHLLRLVSQHTRQAE